MNKIFRNQSLDYPKTQLSDLYTNKRSTEIKTHLRSGWDLGLLRRERERLDHRERHRRRRCEGCRSREIRRWPGPPRGAPPCRSQRRAGNCSGRRRPFHTSDPSSDLSLSLSRIAVRWGIDRFIFFFCFLGLFKQKERNWTCTKRGEGGRPWGVSKVAFTSQLFGESSQ